MSEYLEYLRVISALPPAIESIARIISSIRNKLKEEERARVDDILKEIAKMRNVVEMLRSLGLVIQDYTELIYITHRLDDLADRVIKNEIRFCREIKDKEVVKKLLSTHIEDLCRESNSLPVFFEKPRRILDKDRGKIETLTKVARDSLFSSQGLVKSSEPTLSDTDYEKIEAYLKSAADKIKDILDTSNQTVDNSISILVNLSFQA